MPGTSEQMQHFTCCFIRRFEFWQRILIVCQTKYLINVGPMRDSMTSSPLKRLASSKLRHAISDGRETCMYLKLSLWAFCIFHLVDRSDRWTSHFEASKQVRWRRDEIAVRHRVVLPLKDNQFWCGQSPCIEWWWWWWWWWCHHMSGRLWQ